MEETADTELNFEVYRNSAILEGDRLSASLVVAVTLDVHHSLEVVVLQANIDQDSISQTVDIELGSRERSWCGWRHWDRD